MRRVVIFACLALGLVFPGVASAAKTLYVDDSARACGPGALSSVQAAVNAAAPGDTIRVCPGTYAEQVLLPRSKPNLKLRSVARLGATLKPPPGGLPYTGRNPVAIVIVRGENTLIRDLRIQGPLTFEDPEAPCAGHPHTSAIAIPQGSALIDSNRITDISLSCPGQQRSGAGVHSGDFDGDFSDFMPRRSNVRLDRNVIEAVNGVIAEADSTMVVQRNTITGPGRHVRGSRGFFLLDTFEIAPSVTVTLRSNDISKTETGIEGRNGGHPLILTNELHDNGTAVHFDDAHRGELRNNVIEDNGVGIELARQRQNLNRWLVRNNLIRNSAVDGLRILGRNNSLADNRSLGSGRFDCLDDTFGSGTAGTGNTWSRNIGVTDSPDVCRPR